MPHPRRSGRLIRGYDVPHALRTARMCAAVRPTFHIANPDCLISAREIRHCPAGTHDEVTTTGWLPPSDPIAIGLTSGASTPDNLVGATVIRLQEFCA